MSYVILYGKASLYDGPPFDDRANVRTYEHNGRTYLGQETTDSVYVCDRLCLSDFLAREPGLTGHAKGLAVEEYGSAVLDIGNKLGMSDFDGLAVTVDWQPDSERYPDYAITCGTCGDVINRSDDYEDSDDATPVYDIGDDVIEDWQALIADNRKRTDRIRSAR